MCSASTRLARGRLLCMLPKCAFWRHGCPYPTPPRAPPRTTACSCDCMHACMHLLITQSFTLRVRRAACIIQMVVRRARLACVAFLLSLLASGRHAAAGRCGAGCAHSSIHRRARHAVLHSSMVWRGHSSHRNACGGSALRGFSEVASVVHAVFGLFIPACMHACMHSSLPLPQVVWHKLLPRMTAGPGLSLPTDTAMSCHDGALHGPAHPLAGLLC